MPSLLTTALCALALLAAPGLAGKNKKRKSTPTPNAAIVPTTPAPTTFCMTNGARVERCAKTPGCIPKVLELGDCRDGICNKGPNKRMNVCVAVMCHADYISQPACNAQTGICWWDDDLDCLKELGLPGICRSGNRPRKCKDSNKKACEKIAHNGGNDCHWDLALKKCMDGLRACDTYPNKDLCRKAIIHENRQCHWFMGGGTAWVPSPAGCMDGLTHEKTCEDAKNHKDCVDTPAPTGCHFVVVSKQGALLQACRPGFAAPAYSSGFTDLNDPCYKYMKNVKASNKAHNQYVNQKCVDNPGCEWIRSQLYNPGVCARRVESLTASPTSALTNTTAPAVPAPTETPTTTAG